MSDRAYTSQELEAYVNGQLDEKRKSEIDILANSDTALQEELEILLLTAEISREAERQRLKQTLSGTSNRRPLIIITATLLAACIALFFMLDLGGSPSLYAEYYEPLRENVIMRDSEVHPALQAYAKGDYSRALELFQEIGNPDSLNIYLGICFMEAERFDESLTVLSSINANDSDFVAARWYSALCYLAKNKSEDCRRILMSIESDSPYHVQAADLLRQIK